MLLQSVGLTEFFPGFETSADCCYVTKITTSELSLLIQAIL